MAVEFKAVNQIAKDFVQAACKMYPVTRALLFGSYAKGTPREWSDIDIALFLDIDDEEQLDDIAIELMSLDRVLVPLSWDTYIEPHVYTKARLASEHPFIKEILCHGHEIALPLPSSDQYKL